MSAQMESGTETFSVQGNNRLELSARTQAEINARTARLSSEGRMVTNVNTSMPQAFTVGFTVWRNDVCIIWQASLDSPQYQGYLYRQAIAQYQAGQYSQALNIFQKITGYSDSQTYANQCVARINAQNQARYQAAQTAAQIKSACGTGPFDANTNVGIITLFVGGLILFISIFFLIGGGLSSGGPSDPDNHPIFVWGVVLFIIGAVCIIWILVKEYLYEKKVAEYKSRTSNK